MTPEAGDQPLPDGHALIAGAREALPGLPTDSLFRIRALLERLLNGDELDPQALAELATELGGSELA